MKLIILDSQEYRHWQLRNSLFKINRGITYIKSSYTINAALKNLRRGSLDFAFACDSEELDTVAFIKILKSIDNCKDLPIAIYSSGVTKSRVMKVMAAGAKTVFAYPYNTRTLEGIVEQMGMSQPQNSPTRGRRPLRHSAPHGHSDIGSHF